MKSYEVIKELKNHLNKDIVIVSSNGNISREVFHYLPKPQFYLRGSMGLPISVGLGLALANPEKQILVITGDGNFLMGFGSITTAAYYHPNNMKILIFDNDSYFTTGDQKTVSSIINYESLLKSLQVLNSHSIDANQKEVPNYLKKFLESKSFSVLHLKIEKGKEQLENIPWHPTKIAQNMFERLNPKISKSN